MTTYLTRLASMALGRRAPGAAHVTLPPRFAPASAVSSVTPAQWSAADEPVDAAETTPPALRQLPPQQRDEHHHDRPRVPPAPAPVALPAAAPTKATSAPSVGDAPLQRPAAMPQAGEARAARPDDIALPPPTVRIIAPTRRHDGTPTITTPPVPFLAPQPRPDAAPLSESAVAARIAPPVDAAPVIHVTIDRIDVRAPETTRPAAPARPTRRQPSMSLADYLRTGGGSRA